MEILVKLTFPDDSYSIGKSNPAVRTEYECIGRVTEITDYVEDTTFHTKNNGFEFEEHDIEEIEDLISGEYNEVEISVDWENGHSNTYKSGELTIQDNILSKCKSIW